jgi:hypothetical protein
MLYTAVKQALKAFVHPVVGRLTAVVSSPLLSASRHVGVSDWCSVKNTEDQEGEGRRVRRVRFASNAKKNDGRLEGWKWKPSSIPREVGDEVCYVSMPSTYQDGNFDDWLQHHQEDLEKRTSFWQLVHKKSLVGNEFQDLHILIQKKQQEFKEWEDKMIACDPRALYHYDYYVSKMDAVEKEFYALRQQLQQKHDEFFELERKIDALDTPEVGEENEPMQEVQEDGLQENDSLEFQEEIPFEESVQEEGEEEPMQEVQEDGLKENDTLDFKEEIPFEESVQEEGR